MSGDRIRRIVETRRDRPEAIAAAAAARRRPEPFIGSRVGALIIAADHPARGAFAAGSDPLAMADRGELLERICAALSRPGVTGFLGTPDVVEDLLLLGALDGKHVFGSMNRAGLAGSVFEFDDRFTAYDAAMLAAMGLDGGKMLLRINLEDAATAATLEACGRAIGELAARRLPAMVETFVSRRVDGRVKHDLSAEAAMRAITIATGLGPTSAYTWLKVPLVEDLERVMHAATVPALILGGEVSHDQDAMFEAWRRALALPTVMGLVIGRSLLFPPDGDVAAAVDVAGSLVLAMASTA
jgi:hypothetical protein